MLVPLLLMSFLSGLFWGLFCDHQHNQIQYAPDYPNSIGDTDFIQIIETSGAIQQQEGLPGGQGLILLSVLAWSLCSVIWTSTLSESFPFSPTSDTCCRGKVSDAEGQGRCLYNMVSAKQEYTVVPAKFLSNPHGRVQFRYFAHRMYKLWKTDD